MQNESSLRRSGKWTSFVSCQVNRMRRELVADLGTEPQGRKRFLLDSFCAKYGVYLVFLRELKRRELIEPSGDAIGLLDRNFLSWQHSLSRDLGLLFGDLPTKDKFEGLIA